AVLVATEVNETIVLLMAAPTVTYRDVTIVVAAGTASFLFEQTGVRSALVQIRVHHLDHATATGRGRLDFYECHLVHLRKVEFLSVFQRDISLAFITAATNETAKTLFFTFGVQDLDGLDFNLEEEFDGGLDFLLGRIGNDAESDLLIFFGNERGFFSHDGCQDNLHQACGIHPNIS